MCIWECMLPCKINATLFKLSCAVCVHSHWSISPLSRLDLTNFYFFPICWTSTLHFEVYFCLNTSWTISQVIIGHYVFLLPNIYSSLLSIFYWIVCGGDYLLKIFIYSGYWFFCYMYFLLAVFCFLIFFKWHLKRRIFFLLVADKFINFCLYKQHFFVSYPGVININFIMAYSYISSCMNLKIFAFCFCIYL